MEKIGDFIQEKKQKLFGKVVSRVSYGTRHGGKPYYKSTMSKAIAEQLTDILNRYRNMNSNDEKQKEDLSKMIGISSIPNYHKEILITVLLSKTESEMVCSLEISRQRERIRHAEALVAIESRALEERMRKIQRA